MNEQHKPRLLTIKEAAALIDGLGEHRIRALCISGELKHHKFGKKYMIAENILLEYFGLKAG